MILSQMVWRRLCWSPSLTLSGLRIPLLDIALIQFSEKSVVELGQLAERCWYSNVVSGSAFAREGIRFLVSIPA